MTLSKILRASCLLSAFLALTNGQTSDPISTDQIPPTPTTSTSIPVGTVINGTSTTFRPIFTIPAHVLSGTTYVLPNIADPAAVNAQTACPGYTASQLEENERGLTAVLTLAGAPCNVYGTDIDVLSLKVEYQDAHRLAVTIRPAYLVSRFLVYENRAKLTRTRTDPTRLSISYLKVS